MSNLIKHQGQSALQLNTVDEMQKMASLLAQSGFFSDTKSAAQAFVKVLAGKELGFPAFASMTGIHMVQGRPVVGANLIAAAIKAHPNYRFRVTEHTNEKCSIEFLERVDGEWEICGVSEFTIEDAQAAGLKGKAVWKSFPRNMLYARAISNGARWYCPDVFLGAPVYTPEEMGVEVDQDGNVLDISAITIDQPQSAKSKLPFKSPAEAIQWGVTQTGLSEAEVKQVMDRAKLVDGKKGQSFHDDILQLKAELLEEVKNAEVVESIPDDATGAKHSTNMQTSLDRDLSKSLIDSEIFERIHE